MNGPARVKNQAVPVDAFWIQQELRVESSFHQQIADDNEAQHPGEEFDRMLAAVKEHLPKAQQASVKALMRGLWSCGLDLVNVKIDQKGDRHSMRPLMICGELSASDRHARSRRRC